MVPACRPGRRRHTPACCARQTRRTGSPDSGRFRCSTRRVLSAQRLVDRTGASASAPETASRWWDRAQRGRNTARPFRCACRTRGLSRPALLVGTRTREKPCTSCTPDVQKKINGARRGRVTAWTTRKTSDYDPATCQTTRATRRVPPPTLRRREETYQVRLGNGRPVPGNTPDDPGNTPSAPPHTPTASSHVPSTP